MSSERSEKKSFSMPEINRIVHGPARLTILAHLYMIERADFLFLMRQTRLTKGNLSSNLITLEKAGYIEITKEFIEKTPRTLLRLSEMGREAFREYRDDMKRVLDELSD